MAKFQILKGSTSVIVPIFIGDYTSSTGGGLTGLVSTDLTCYAARSDDGNAGGTSVSLSAGTRGTWSSGGFVEKDSTNMPGVYELGLTNASLASGSRYATYLLKPSGAKTALTVLIEIELTNVDNQSSTFGLGALTIGTNNDKTGYTLTNAGYAAVMTQQLTESYASKGTVPTPAQALLEIRALLAENNVSGTTVTTKQINSSTTAHTYTLNDPTTPTSITTAS